MSEAIDVKGGEKINMDLASDLDTCIFLGPVGIKASLESFDASLPH